MNNNYKLILLAIIAAVTLVIVMSTQRVDANYTHCYKNCVTPTPCPILDTAGKKVGEVTSDYQIDCEPTPTVEPTITPEPTIPCDEAPSELVLVAGVPCPEEPTVTPESTPSATPSQPGHPSDERFDTSGDGRSDGLCSKPPCVENRSGQPLMPASQAPK